VMPEPGPQDMPIVVRVGFEAEVRMFTR
jgi:hypothetical protein